MLRCLPRLPIFIDYRTTTVWKEKEENLAIATLGQRDRVRRIVLGGPRSGSKLLGALNHPFPKLESLICVCSYPALVLPPTFLSGSTLCLRQLILEGVSLGGLSPLLSSAINLVELTLHIAGTSSAPSKTSLLTNLKCMPRLRRLELTFSYWDFAIPNSSSHPAGAGTVVPLSELTHFIFRGDDPFLQMLVDELAAPSLQHLDASPCGPRPMSSIPRLCKFIGDIERRFNSVRIDFSLGKVDFSEVPLSKFTESQAFRIPSQRGISLEQMGNMLAVLLSTVEELVVEWDLHANVHRRDIRWRGFFKNTTRVKTIQVTSNLVANVARSFQQDGYDLDLLPALEQIKVRKAPHGPRKEGQYGSICRAFGPLITARQREGQPIGLSFT